MSLGEPKELRGLGEQGRYRPVVKVQRSVFILGVPPSVRRGRLPSVEQSGPHRWRGCIRAKWLKRTGGRARRLREKQRNNNVWGKSAVVGVKLSDVLEGDGHRCGQLQDRSALCR